MGTGGSPTGQMLSNMVPKIPEFHHLITHTLSLFKKQSKSNQLQISATAVGLNCSSESASIHTSAAKTQGRIVLGIAKKLTGCRRALYMQTSYHCLTEKHQQTGKNTGDPP